jgi:hypothetical protein
VTAVLSGLMAKNNGSHDGGKRCIARTEFMKYLDNVLCKSTNNKLGGDAKV